MTKAEARAAGLKRYSTGKPCRRGHLCERDIQGHCIECHVVAHRRSVRKWAHQNPEKVRVMAAAGRKRNPEKLRTRQRSYVQKKREKAAGRPIPEHCEVCGRKNPHGWALAFDHDHVTGAFRGWLCHNCNAALGHVEDRPEILLALVFYLKSFGAEVRSTPLSLPRERESGTHLLAWLSHMAQEMAQ